MENNIQQQLELAERELRIGNYSPRTRKSYLYYLQKYFDFKKSDIDKMDTENIKNFLEDNEKNGVSAQVRNLTLNSIKFYYYSVVKIRNKIEIRSAKEHAKLPTVLSRDEIRKLIEVTTNLKHKLLLGLSYGAGLRVSEVLKLKVGDISLEELTVIIRQSKGQKDRISIIPDKLVDSIRNLTVEKDGDDFVFESETRFPFASMR